MSHDPELLAAELMSGELPRRQRRRLERHLLDCEDCWREVALARRGREVAEELRLVSPPAVRDRIRAIVDVEPLRHLGGFRRFADLIGAPRRPRWALAAALLSAAILVGVQVNHDTPPGQIAGLARMYQHQPLAGDPSREPPPVSGAAGYTWSQARRLVLAGQPVIVHEYVSAHGGRILLARATVEFPRPGNAQNLASGDWIADVQHVRMYCTNRPQPTIVLGTDPDAVAAVAASATG